MSSLRQLAVLLLTALTLFSCSNPEANVRPATPAGPASARGATTTVTRDLAQDEVAGGHTLRKHVGRTDDQLRERLEREPHISAASTYTDRAVAEQTVGAAIAQNSDRVSRWLERSGRRANLVLDYEAAQPVGRVLRRGATSPSSCAHATIVLKSQMDTYYVLTSYPECR